MEGQILPQSRRAMLQTIGAVGVVALAGCLGSEESAPAPVALDDGRVCDSCGMQIDRHPGPVGQAFYLADAPPALPEDRKDGIAWFCSSKCTYAFTLGQAEQGYTPVGRYGTDYSGLSYELTDDDGTTVITSHLSADAFAPVTDLTFVVDSDAEGAMGPSLIGFSDESDATAFAEEYGGELFAHEDVTLEVIESMQM